MNRLTTLILTLLISSSSWAFNFGDNTEANAKASAKAGAIAAPIMVLKNPVTVSSTGSDPNIPPVVSSAYAHAPSAQCRFGWGVQFGVQEFGIGGSGSEWDRICGLWMAAQQTTGDPSNEAATAAFCLTMKDAEVHSETCAAWENGQNLAKNKVVGLTEERGNIIFGGSGNGGWN